MLGYSKLFLKVPPHLLFLERILGQTGLNALLASNQYMRFLIFFHPSCDRMFVVAVIIHKGLIFSYIFANNSVFYECCIWFLYLLIYWILMFLSIYMIFLILGAKFGSWILDPSLKTLAHIKKKPKPGSWKYLCWANLGSRGEIH